MKKQDKNKEQKQTQLPANKGKDKRESNELSNTDLDKVSGGLGKLVHRSKGLV